MVTAAEDYDATWKAGLHRLDSTQRSSLHLRFSTSLPTTCLFTRLLYLMFPRAHNFVPSDVAFLILDFRLAAYLVIRGWLRKTRGKSSRQQFLSFLRNRLLAAGTSISTLTSK